MSAFGFSNTNLSLNDLVDHRKYGSGLIETIKTKIISKPTDNPIEFLIVRFDFEAIFFATFKTSVFNLDFE